MEESEQRNWNEQLPPDIMTVAWSECMLLNKHELQQSGRSKTDMWSTDSLRSGTLKEGVES